ncbi:MAG: hypothetical protein ABIP74_00050 [Candidatus Saccharimonas sp.]
MRIDRKHAYALAPKALASSESQVFADDDVSEFGIVTLGMGEDRWKQPELTDLWHEFRYKIYRAHGYLGHSRVENEREYDEDDDRAVHLLVLKRLRPHELIAVAGMRCMIKDAMSRPLPVEEYFAHAFNEPAPIGSIETSRLISVELNLAKQRQILRHMFAVAYVDTMERVGEFQYTYGVMGADLETTLPRFAGLPITRISDEVPVPYGTDDIAIKGDMMAFRKNYGEPAFEQLRPTMGEVFRWGVLKEVSDAA